MSLYPRRTYAESTKRIPDELRRKAEAHQILDRARAGHPVTAEEIDRALRITGDLT